jgi:hypothetical protein
VTTAPGRQDKQHLGTRDGEIKPEGRIKVLRKRVDFSVFLKSPVQEKGIPLKSLIRHGQPTFLASIGRMALLEV